MQLFDLFSQDFRNIFTELSTSCDQTQSVQKNIKFVIKYGTRYKNWSTLFSWIFFNFTIFDIK